MNSTQRLILKLSKHVSLCSVKVLKLEHLKHACREADLSFDSGTVNACIDHWLNRKKQVKQAFSNSYDRV